MPTSRGTAAWQRNPPCSSSSPTACDAPSSARCSAGEHREKPFFGELVEFITSGPVVAARLEGEGAVAALRMLMGPTNPIEAPPGSMRGDYCTIITENLVHGSDSAESAERELKLFFG